MSYLRIKAKFWRRLPQSIVRVACRLTGGHWWHGMPMNRHCCHCGHSEVRKKKS